MHLQIHGRVITGAEVSFRAPYSVTSANQGYFLSARIGRRGLAGSGSDADVARGATVSIPIGGVLSLARGRTVKVEVSYTRFSASIPESTPVGSAIVREPPGTHSLPLPRRREWLVNRRSSWLSGRLAHRDGQLGTVVDRTHEVKGKSKLQ